MSIAAFGLVTSLGGHTPLGRLVYDVVPLAGGFRAWARNLVLVDVAVACLAGSGVRAVLASPTRWRRPFSIGILGLAGALLILPALTDLGGAIAHGHDRAITFGGPIVLLLGVLGALALLPIQRQWGTTLLVLTCSLDMVAFTAAAPWTSDGGSPAQVTRYYSAEPASIGAPADEPGGVDRWVSQSGQPRGVALVKEYPSVNGYDPIIQASYARTVSDMAGSGELYRTDFLEPGWLADVLRVTTLIVDHEVVPTDPLWRRDRSLLGGLVRWVRTPRLAEAMLVGNVQFASLDEIRDRLRSSATDLTRTAYIESGPTADGAGRGAATDESPGVVIGSMGPTGSGRFDVDATSPALLVISSTWLDGWRATVDGTSVPVVRANGLVLGVAVPAGRHTVVVNFTPPGVRLGLLVSVLSLVGLVTPSVAMASRGRRRSPPLA